MDKFKKVSISSRIPAELNEKLRAEANETDAIFSEVVERAISFYYANKDKAPAPLPEPGPQKPCILLSDMKITSVACLLEMSEKLQLSHAQIIDFACDKIFNAAGDPEPQYVEEAKQLLNK